jgi:hypothetical protein
MAREQFQDCIDACNAAAEACNACAVACLFQPNREDLARCVQLDMDCAEICRLAAAYTARDSELIGQIAWLTAEVCDTCADECERHSFDACRACARACRECAAECRNMLVMVKTSRVPRTTRYRSH